CQPEEEGNLLHHFIGCESPPVIKYLLKHKPQETVEIWLNQKNKKNCLPIHTAAIIGNSEVVKVLLKSCPKDLLNEKDEKGNTPLHLAAKRTIQLKENRKEFALVIQLLLECNANPEVKNSDGKKPFDLACDSEEVKEILFDSNQFCFWHLKNEMTRFYISHDTASLKAGECSVNLSIVKEEVQKKKETEALTNRSSREQLFRSYENVFEATNKEPGVSEMSENSVISPNDSKNEPLPQLDNRMILDSGVTMPNSGFLIRHKGPILAKDLFEPSGGNNPKKILILGRAGIGKKALCRYLTYQWWGENSVWKDQFDLVVKINLRNLTKKKYGNKNVSLEEIIVRECFQSINEENQKEIEHTRKALHPDTDKKKLFIFVGYDEFPEDSPCKRTIDNLLCNQNNFYCIVTSRSYANFTHTNFDLYLECIGFTSRNILSYLELSGACKNTNAAKGIFAFLKQNPEIHNLAHIPILLNLLTRSSETILAPESSRITELYIYIVDKLWERYYLKQLEANSNQEYIVELQQQAEKFLKALAFHSLLEEVVVFSYEAIKKVAMATCKWKGFQVSSQLKDLLSPGFLNCYRGKTFEKNSYSFLHLTIQEYFAALYITDWLSADEREKIKAEQFISENRNNSHFLGVWGFMSKIIPDNEFYLAIKNGNLTALNDLYKLDESIICKFSEDGWTAIHEAIKYNQIVVLKWLFEKDKEFFLDCCHVKINNPPLHLAASLGLLDIGKWLIEKDSKLIDITNQNGETPFDIAKDEVFSDWLQSERAKREQCDLM
ncbi:MAG: ankyrin repeat domain-containing protein, partial [Parachlamydiaceae bacterium]